jgi:RND family efflux transporter MFP subunit
MKGLQFILINLLLVELLLMLVACSDEAGHETDQASEKKPTVTIREIKPWQDAMVRHFPGVVRPGRRASLSTRMNGTIRWIGVQAGDRVEEGDLLARVESRDVEATLAAARKQVLAAEAALDQAVRDVERLRQLVDEDLMARQRLEEAQVKRWNAEAKVEKARAEVRVQQINRSYAEIKAPFSGVVSELLIDEGSFVGAGHPVVVLEDRKTFRIDLPVSSDVAERFASDDARLIVAPSEQEMIPASYVATVPVLEAGGVGQLVRLVVRYPPPTLQPGQVVDVRLIGPVNTGWMALPQSALIRRGQLTGVLVLESTQSDARIQLRWIRLAAGWPGQSEMVPVDQGLTNGSFVVVHPSPDLQDGQVVQPKQETL